MILATNAGGHQDPWWVYPVVLGGLAAICTLLWLINRFIVHFFPSTGRPHTTVGNALMRVEATFLPGREYVLEASEHDEVDEDDQGDPPTTGEIHDIRRATSGCRETRKKRNVSPKQESTVANWSANTDDRTHASLKQ